MLRLIMNTIYRSRSYRYFCSLVSTFFFEEIAREKKRKKEREPQETDVSLIYSRFFYEISEIPKISSDILRDKQCLPVPLYSARFSNMASAILLAHFPPSSPPFAFSRRFDSPFVRCFGCWFLPSPASSQTTSSICPASHFVFRQAENDCRAHRKSGPPIGKRRIQVSRRNMGLEISSNKATPYILPSF